MQVNNWTEEWFVREISPMGAEDWHIDGAATYDSAIAANKPWKCEGWDYRIVKKTLQSQVV